jgi:TRAP-type C4-dicarboxylate transport system permease small subunit
MQTKDATAPDGPLVLQWYRNAMRLVAGTSMLAIVVIMVVQVFARYVLNASLI